MLYLWNELISGRKKRGCLQSPEDPLTLWWVQNCILPPYYQESGGLVIPGDTYSSVYHCPGRTARLQLLSFCWCSKHTGFLSIQLPSWSLWITSRDHIQMVSSIENRKVFLCGSHIFLFKTKTPTPRSFQKTSLCLSGQSSPVWLFIEQYSGKRMGLQCLG